ncbi:coiled-coil domain-containing protein-domain-containing protein [Xylaria flabelliformis]|nr:coiled-coil domain-containing protein-domain-containing protein [Xylaria flabelliformis]
MALLINSLESPHPEPGGASASPQESSPSSPYERPQPRPPKTPAHAAQIRVRNRRREWLSRHPSYFRSLEHELADPVLYDALIRRFQSSDEREKEGRAKGFGRVLEIDLLRGEARLSKLADNAPRGRGSFDGNTLPGRTEYTNSPIPQSSGSRSSSATWGLSESHAAPETQMSWDELEALEAHDLEKRSTPKTAEEGRARWDEFLRLRFVAGGDEDFSYRTVDEDDEYDALERREQEDAWFDNEEPGWVESDDEDETGPGEKGKKTAVERPLSGETGVQDF